MPSPFPGMNPYLERADLWPDFHGTFLFLLRSALVPQVRPKYVVRAEMRVVLDPADAVAGVDGDDPATSPARRDRKPDVSVMAGDPHAEVAARGGGGGVATLPSPAEVQFVLPRGAEPWEQASMEVRTRDGDDLVTAVELISPTNKVGPGRRDYQEKRRDYARRGANLVEIDLLRLAGPIALRGAPPSAYRAAVARPEQWPAVRVWPIGLRDPLPTVPVPLRPPDPDATIDLQAVLHRAYDAAAYGDYVYRREPRPALRGEDLAWARSVAGLDQ